MSLIWHGDPSDRPRLPLSNSRSTPWAIGINRAGWAEGSTLLSGPPDEQDHHAPLNFWPQGPPGSPDLGVSPMVWGPAEPGWASPCGKRCTSNEATSIPPWESTPGQDQDLHEDDEELWRLHLERTSRRPQRPLHPKPSVRPQRPLHGKTLHGKRLHGKTTGASHGAASGVGAPSKPARLLPSLARDLGPPPRRRHRRRPRASSVTIVRASATQPAPAKDNLSVPNAAGHTGAPCA